MIEIIFLFLLCKDIGKIVHKNGRKALGYQLMLIGLWFAGEIAGFMLGIAAIAFVDRRTEYHGFPWEYIVGLFGAGVGAFIAFRIARSTRPKPLSFAFPVILYDPSDTMDGPIK